MQCASICWTFRNHDPHFSNQDQRPPDFKPAWRHCALPCYCNSFTYHFHCSIASELFNITLYHKKVLGYVIAPLHRIILPSSFTVRLCINILAKHCTLINIVICLVIVTFYLIICLGACARAAAGNKSACLPISTVEVTFEEVASVICDLPTYTLEGRS